MAKNVGIVQFTGSIGNVTGTAYNGKVYIQKKGGVPKVRIETDPVFQRTRENMNEFRGVVQGSKEFLTALAGLKRILADKRVFNRLVKVVKKIQLRADGTRGERPIQFATYGQEMVGFQLHDLNALGSLFAGNVTVSAPQSGKGAAFSVAAFNPKDMFTPPKGATHARLVGAAVLQGDLSYDDLTNSWIYANGDSGATGIERSTYIDLSSDSQEAISLTATMAGVTDTDGGAVLCVFGVEFYQEVDGNYYLLYDTNGGVVLASL